MQEGSRLADSLSSLALLSFLPCSFFLPNTERRFFCLDDLNKTIPQVWLPQTTEPQSSNPSPVSRYARELDHFSFRITTALPLLCLCTPYTVTALRPWDLGCPRLRLLIRYGAGPGMPRLCLCTFRPCPDHSLTPLSLAYFRHSSTIIKRKI